ncbi:MAG TPA: SRPBCC family protein [Nocardioides sp.]|nr:SRPBCC family protein [Nocardioides sp.]
MLTFVRDVTAPAPPDRVFDYLADFTTVDEWDPRASRVRRVRGDGGEGSTYECEVSFARRTVPMRYTVVRLVPGDTIEWTGESSWVRAHDVIRLRTRGGATHVEYTTQYRYRHASWLLERLLSRAVSRLCDDAREGLQHALDRRGRRTPVT